MRIVCKYKVKYESPASKLKIMTTAQFLLFPAT